MELFVLCVKCLVMLVAIRAKSIPHCHGSCVRSQHLNNYYLHCPTLWITSSYDFYIKMQSNIVSLSVFIILQVRQLQLTQANSCVIWTDSIFNQKLSKLRRASQDTSNARRCGLEHVGQS